MSEDIFRERGITPATRKARRYRSYGVGAGPDEIPELARHERYLQRYTASPGWLMPKYPVMDGLPPIRPQLRPDKAIEHKPWSHRHRDMPAHELKAHLASKKRASEHEGVALNDEHWHQDTSKYVLGPGGDDAKRLDRNPLTDFAEPGRVFFVIEGTPKNDALVSCGEKAFNVPAVAQWAAPELPRFAREHLLGEQIFVVPDSDWAENSEVIFHAVCCREYLRRIGVDAHIAAPPSRWKGVDDFIGAGGTPDKLLVLPREVDEEAFAPWWDAYRKFRAGAYAKTLELDERVTRILILASAEGRTLRGVEALTSALMAKPHGRRGHEMTEIEAEERWGARTHQVYRALGRLANAGAYTLTGAYPGWMGAGWKMVKKDKFIWTPAGLRRPAPELRLHGDLRLVERPPLELSKMQVEQEPKMQVEQEHA